MAISNGVLFQYFHWHTKNDGSLWREAAQNALALQKIGITSVWLPPAYKGQAGVDDTGYGVYDLFDLGEFDQKGATRTKYGTRDEYLNAVKAIRDAGMEAYADIVLNHRCGADETEIVDILEVDMNDRTKVMPDSQHKAEVWTKYTFPGRAGEHSKFTWTHQHFTAVDHKVEGDEPEKLYLMAGKKFSGEVSPEHGNFDFLMGCDVDMYHPDVVAELRHWGHWYIDTTDIDGFRLDAVKHIPASFYRDYIKHLRAENDGRELLSIGEYWATDVADLHTYLEQTEGVIKLFDVPLHMQLSAASKSGKDFDMRTIFEGSLVAENPLMAVTFVDNHDTQPGQSLESWVDDWFKPMAYAAILLRQGGYPVVFYGDYYGASEKDCKLTSHKKLIELMLEARRKYNHGDQHDYLDHANCIAWVRTGDDEHPGKMVVVLSNGDTGTKRVNTYAKNAAFIDMTGHNNAVITTDDNAEADFTCPAGSLSIWVQK